MELADWQQESAAVASALRGDAVWTQRGDGVIVRVLRANVRAGRVGAFNAIFRRQVALMREQPGLVYVKLARRLQADGGEEAVLFEEWQDAASLYGWVGPNLTEPRLIPGVRDLIDEIHVAHYEVLSEEGETLGLSGEAGMRDSGGGAAGSDATAATSDATADDAGRDASPRASREAS